MWIEVASMAKLGMEQNVRVYFGEYSWGKPTVTAKWFSDIKEYKLMVKAPDGSTFELKDKKQDSTFYATSFTPTQKGVYTIWLSHEVKDVYKDMKLTYTSAAFVNTANKAGQTITLGEGKSQLKYNSKRAKYTYLENGKTMPGAVLAVAKAGDKDAASNVTTDKNGNFALPKSWKGRFLIELSDPKTEDGTHNGTAYKTNYTEFTYQVNL